MSSEIIAPTVSSAPLLLCPPRSSDIARGQELAIRMLLELEGGGDRVDRCMLDSRRRNAGQGRRYENVFLRELHEARRPGEDVEQGFTQIARTGPPPATSKMRGAAAPT